MRKKYCGSNKLGKIDGSTFSYCPTILHCNTHLSHLPYWCGPGAAASGGNPGPNCIEMKTEWGFVQAYNNCDTTKTLNLKAKMAFGPDTKCLPVKPGTRANIGPALGRFDGVVVCPGDYGTEPEGSNRDSLGMFTVKCPMMNPAPGKRNEVVGYIVGTSDKSVKDAETVADMFASLVVTNQQETAVKQECTPQKQYIAMGAYNANELGT